MSISFSQLSALLNQQKKKSGKKGKGITGLPTFSYDDPRYQQKLRMPDGDDEDCGGKGQPECEDDCNPNNEYCNPWQNQGPNEGEIGSDPDNPDGGWGEYWQWLKDRQHGGDQTPPRRVCSDPPCIIDADYEFENETTGPDPQLRPRDTDNVENRTRPEGPEGPDETDDLFDPWKYRGVTNPHSLYYQDK